VDVAEPQDDRQTRVLIREIVNLLGRLFLMAVFGAFVAGAVRGYDAADWRSWEVWATLPLSILGLLWVGSVIDERIRTGRW
jgi:hypothetical protein